MNKNWLLDEVLGGYQVSSTLQLTSGNPFSVFASSVNDFAEVGGGTPFASYTGQSTRPRQGRSIKEWYNPSAFTIPAEGTLGNVRRNSLYGPGLELINISAGKKFDIHENVKLQIRLDANNAFNHPSFGQPNGGLNNCVYNPDLQNLETCGGLNRNTQPGDPFPEDTIGQQITGVKVGGRTLQGGVRLEF